MKKNIFLTSVVLLLAFLISGCTCEYHNLEDEIIIEATCTKDGVLEKHCTDCNYTIEEPIPSSHDFQRDKIIKEATCTEDGRAIDKCSKCGETTELTLLSGHSFTDGECTKCNAKKSDITPDTWYTLTSNDIFHCQNAEIDNAIPISKGSAFMVTYYPVCKKCLICGPMEMTGVDINKPISETYYCDSCGEATYARFKIEF